MSENQEKVPVHFRVEEDGEGNIKMDISGKGGDLVQILASVVDDDPAIKQLFEYVLMLVNMKQASEAGDDEGEFKTISESDFFDTPPAEA